MSIDPTVSVELWIPCVNNCKPAGRLVTSFVQVTMTHVLYTRIVCIYCIHEFVYTALAAFISRDTQEFQKDAGCLMLPTIQGYS